MEGIQQPPSIGKLGSATAEFDVVVSVGGLWYSNAPTFGQLSSTVRHFLENFYTTFNDASVREFIWIAATTALPRNFGYHMGEIRKASPWCAEWLLKYDKALWTQAFLFPLKRWRIFTTNMCESTNSQLRVARSYPFAALVQDTHVKAAVYFAKRHDRSFTRTKSITRYASKKLVKVVNKTKQCIPTSYGNNKFSVDHLGELYIVDLTLRTCSCLQFQSVGIPCIHACSSIMRMGLDLADYCHDWYSMDNYRRTYTVTLASCEGYSRWPYDPTSEYIIPPVWKRSGGRRKKRKRIESQSVLRVTVRCRGMPIRHPLFKSELNVGSICEIVKKVGTGTGQIIYNLFEIQTNLFSHAGFLLDNGRVPSLGPNMCPYRSTRK
ncbi:uncharacterized protein LOC113271884 [Papaver somniferum]|uniref:uncharacterized protein LOC113271884 n=1 Tax=Papaver somniferum TaxID=3469 RepID=UPI000E6FFE76|nr:uncharacterized protein LOC113271884 [Papaver somniferum]